MSMSTSTCLDRAIQMPTNEKSFKAQKDAEFEVASFRKDLGPFVVAAETTRMATVFTDAKEANHPLIFANDSFCAGFRMPAIDSRATSTGGRRPKAAKERTRGDSAERLPPTPLWGFE